MNDAPGPNLEEELRLFGEVYGLAGPSHGAAVRSGRVFVVVATMTSRVTRLGRAVESDADDQDKGRGPPRHQPEKDDPDKEDPAEHRPEHDRQRRVVVLGFDRMLRLYDQRVDHQDLATALDCDHRSHSVGPGLRRRGLPPEPPTATRLHRDLERARPVETQLELRLDRRVALGLRQEGLERPGHLMRMRPAYQQLQPLRPGLGRVDLVADHHGRGHAMVLAAVCQGGPGERDHGE